MDTEGVLWAAQGICEGSLGSKWDRGGSKQECLASGIQPDVLIGTEVVGGSQVPRCPEWGLGAGVGARVSGSSSP